MAKEKVFFVGVSKVSKVTENKSCHIDIPITKRVRTQRPEFFLFIIGSFDMPTEKIDG